MIAQPQPKTQELIDMLNELAGSSSVNIFAIRRVEREAEAMREANPAGASVVLGAAACLKGDLEGMHAHHQNAIALGGGAGACFQYSISLGRVGMLPEALAYAERGYGIDPLFPGGVELIIGDALALGLKPLAKDYASRWQRLNPDKPPCITMQEIEESQGVIRPNVADMIENLLDSHKGLWSALSKQ